MKKAILILALSLLLVAVLIAPVLAAPVKNPNKVSVEVKNKGVTEEPLICQRTGIQYPHSASAWWASNGFKDEGVVAQRRNDDYVRYFDLLIKYESGTVTLAGISFNEFNRMWKYADFDPNIPFPPPPPQPNQAGSDSITHYKAVWEFNRGQSNYGGFEGVINNMIKDIQLPTYLLKADFALQGFGSFEGKTIQMTVEGSVVNNVVVSTWTGFMLTK